MHQHLAKLRTAVTLVFVALLVTFAVQNTQTVEYRFLQWTFETRRALVVMLSTAIGIAIGWLARAPR